MKSSFKFPASATPNEVDRVMEDWCRMTSLQAHFLKSVMLLSCFLDDRIVSPTSVCLFFVDENSYPLIKQQFPELVRFGNSWLDVTTHSKTQALILHWLTVNFVGRGWSGNFEASFWGVEMSESIFFLEYLFTHYRDTKTAKTLLAV